eukprot:TRINITY_DN1150_c0_g1_i1.p1 TRINITY_DN1150_c0_g1~~TRINITY_DN1150_c0_g1_i1.p1  ORF type:complete len:444 (+),score=112.46 TRINITY_DN1150_c0_g1_i1:150-1481(+)
MLSFTVSGPVFFDGVKAIDVDADTVSGVKLALQSLLKISNDFIIKIWTEEHGYTRFSQMSYCDDYLETNEIIPIRLEAADKELKIIRGKSKSKLSSMKNLAKVRRLEQGWCGSPSSTAKLTFSSVANRHIMNKQDIPFQPKDKHKMPKVRPTKKTKKPRSNSPPGNITPSPTEIARETEWKGSPSSYRKLGFSSTANRHIANKQEVPDYDAAQSLGMFMPAFLSQTNGSTKVKKPKSKKKKKVSKEKALEGGWIGVPSSYAQITFSASANKHILNKQDVPSYDASRDPCCPVAAKKTFRKHIKRVTHAQEHEKMVNRRMREGEVRKKDKRGIVSDYCFRVICRTEESLQQENQLDQMKEVFQSFDIEQSSVLCISQFVRAMEALGIYITPIESQSIIEHIGAGDMDVDDPLVAYGEFHRMVIERRKHNIKQKLREERHLGLID